MTSPVFQALVNARLHQVNRGEAVIAEEVSATLGPQPPDTHRPERFIRWCDEQGLPWRPASPPVIAKFVLEHMKIGKLLKEIRCLSLAHSSVGLPDPTAAWQVTEALLRLTKFTSPHSWPASDKVAFLALPLDQQKLIFLREKDRDATVKRAHAEAAEARKQLAAIQKPEETKNGTIIENQPAETCVSLRPHRSFAR